MSNEKLAQQLFDAQTAQNYAESAAYRFLNELLGEGGWCDYTVDYYDRSIEIFGVAQTLVLSDAQQAKLWAVGFDRCWTHVSQERGDNEEGGEKFYAAPPK
jgi:hypothetical protein